MEKLRARFDNQDLAHILDSVPGPPAPAVGGLLFTDRTSVASAASSPVVFIGSSLSAFMRVMLNRHTRGVLLPRDLGKDSVWALVRGTSVFSECDAYDLSMDPLVHEFVSLVAHGATKLHAADAVGYGDRQMRRIVAKLRKDAGMGSSYPWPVLAPLFSR